ncbi:hypothetical protein IC608_01965 [Devosia sp. PTR5]|uniref:Uncharacterized protein n=1 Tax=Devosia oryzisoli TaxID=2774138 RepID=A0A927FRS0_9HYPH|nr:hypothetical protein [Devosia oryzisoli]MBD8064242.1 hypothetical protein [Devosia oryzisoli]
MPPTYVLARDHLERAAVILQGGDDRSLQLRNIIERTISLIEEFEPAAPTRTDNVVDFTAYPAARIAWAR